MRINNRLYAISLLVCGLAVLGACATKAVVTGAPEIQRPADLWAKNGSYPPRQGNEIQIYIDGQEAYGEIAKAFTDAKEFIYMTISYGDQDFMPIPETGETMFDIFRSRQRAGVDVRMVVWQPMQKIPHTIPFSPESPIRGVNDGPGSIQARWDVAKGDDIYPAALGCHHQKTFIMDDGHGGVVAFVGGINPAQPYWDTPRHDSLDVRHAEKNKDTVQELMDNPPLHDIFYKIKGPAVGDVLANFLERYNGASMPVKGTGDSMAPALAQHILPVPGGMELQVLRTIAPKTYSSITGGDRGISEFYLNVLGAAGKGSLVYIENQYFFDQDTAFEIHRAAERGARIIAILESKPDGDTLAGKAEKFLEALAGFEDASKRVRGHKNVALLTLGNSRPDPRAPGKMINSETYIHSKTMAIFAPDWAALTGGSANIAFTSMEFHSEMNIAFMDAPLIKKWVARLWAEHLGLSLAAAEKLIEEPDRAFAIFEQQAQQNTAALNSDPTTSDIKGRVFEWGETRFRDRELNGINLGAGTHPLHAE